MSTTKKITCLIIDDEEPAHEVLKYLIAKVSWLDYAGSCYNAIDAIELIPNLKPDLVFVDVNMPELSGLDLLGIIQIPDSHIIITTAYSEYAIDGFNYDVTSFLLKPIGFDRFLKAVTKVRKLIAGNSEIHGRKEHEFSVPTPDEKIQQFSGKVDIAEQNEIGVRAGEEYIWVKADKKMHCIWFRDIYFIEGLKDYVKVHHVGGVLVTLGSMTNMMNQLPTPPFVRTHRSYIVNRNSIKFIEGNMVTMNNGLQVTIAVSASRDDVLRQLTEK